MEDDIKTKVLLDIVFSIKTGCPEEEILCTALPVFKEKLKCEVVLVFKYQEGEPKLMSCLPADFGGEEAKVFLGIYSPDFSDNKIIEIEFDGFHLLCYQLQDYGFVVFERKASLIENLKQEMLQVCRFWATALMGAVVEQERIHREQYLSVLQHFIENSSDSVQVSHESGQLFYVNKLASERLAIRKEDCKNYVVSDFESIFKDMNVWHEHVNELKGTEFMTIEGVHINQKTGKKIPVEVTARYLNINGSGFVTANARDISERKMTENNLNQQMHLQRIMLDISTKFINIDLDVVGEAIMDSLQKLGEYVGADRAYVFDYDFENQIARNTYEWCGEGIKPEMEHLQDVPFAVIPQGIEVHKRGREFYVPDVSAMPDDGPEGIRAFLEPQDIKSLISFPLLNGNELLGFVGFDSVREHHQYSEKEKSLLAFFAYVLVNIRQRRLKEMQLHFQEEKYRNIIDNMNLGLLEVDKEENIMFCNAGFREMSGYASEEIVGKRANEMFVSERHRKIVKSKLGLRDQGVSDSYEILVRNKRGDARWWLISGGPNYNDKGDIIGSIGIHLDITQQKHLEEKLETALENAKAASIAKESFLANMSHEIRTPLNGIIGMVRAMSKEPNLSPILSSYLSSAKKASGHLLSVVNNILDISKIEAGELKLEIREFLSKELLDDVRQILFQLSEEKGLKLNVTVDVLVKEVLIGDQARIRQIILNLASNAIKFTSHGSVDISLCAVNTSKYHQTLVFSVKDTGMGMDEAFLQNAFNKFQQEDASISRKFGGSGLGLIITKELLELMNGELSITSSKGIGTDAKVKLTLPIGDKKNISANEQIDLNLSFKNKSVLVVEDNELNRLVLLNALSPLEPNIVEAENGLEALELIRNHDFDMVLMDIQMPVMDGIEATKIIRAEVSKTIPIIGLSADAFKTEIEKCLKAGMNDYLTKPFEEKELWLIMNKYIGNESVRPNVEGNIAQTVTVRKHAYNLGKLKEMSRGNDEFVSKMLKLFVQITPESVNHIRQGIAQADLGLVKHYLHRLKPSLSYLEANELYAELASLEQYELENGDFEAFGRSVENTMTKLLELAQAINDNELK